MSTHVNLVDLLAFKSTGEEVTKFSSEVALSNYTIGTDSYFPREHVLAGSLIYYLLRNILNPSLDRGRRRTDHTGRERKRKADRDHVRGGDRGQSGRG
ncbi:hypothetical protein BDN72DRAFT_96406 [Pluteus cervinus]|uniref:Uncharacterized protein n=1 Tax=Pluteus cervinus TaxID=181527 RepID=A0ACD3AP36_9AGAR|nr:hypothetical protein BDN72DRAFT_96406 [Pluteus cervinus]